MNSSRDRACDLIVFDMAGTTVYDGDAVHDSIREAMACVAHCTVTRDEVNTVMGLQKPTAIRVLLRQALASEPTDDLVNCTYEDFEKRMIGYYTTSPAVREVAAVSDLFRTLKGMGIKTAVDTGFSRSIAQVILDRLGWEKQKLIDASVTVDEVSMGRPAPFMIHRCMEKTGVTNVSRVVKVGDTPSDLYEGTNAGCGLVIGVTTGSHTAEELRIHPHTHLIPDVSDLLRCLESAQTAHDPATLRLFTPEPLNSSITVK
jgi:phosphonatase-like hydrolase